MSESKESQGSWTINGQLLEAVLPSNFSFVGELGDVLGEDAIQNIGKITAVFSKVQSDSEYNEKNSQWEWNFYSGKRIIFDIAFFFCPIEKAPPKFQIIVVCSGGHISLVIDVIHKIDRTYFIYHGKILNGCVCLHPFFEFINKMTVRING